jgi:hypothetical protein
MMASSSEKQSTAPAISKAAWTGTWVCGRAFTGGGDGTIEAGTAKGCDYTCAATGLEANAIAQVQAQVRERRLRNCARLPFALDRQRELDPERLLYEVTKPDPGKDGSLLLTPLGVISC